MLHDEIIDSKEEGMLADEECFQCHSCKVAFNFIGGHLSLLLYFMSKKHYLLKRKRHSEGFRTVEGHRLLSIHSLWDERPGKFIPLGKERPSGKVTDVLSSLTMPGTGG